VACEKIEMETGCNDTMQLRNVLLKQYYANANQKLTNYDH